MGEGERVSGIARITYEEVFVRNRLCDLAEPSYQPFDRAEGCGAHRMSVEAALAVAGHLDGATPPGPHDAHDHPTAGDSTMGSGILQFFAYSHLPPHLQVISKFFGDLAKDMAESLPDNPEREMTLRKLLEAKDCAVRSILFKPAE